MNDDHYICKTNNIICSKFNLNQKNFQKLINGEYINDKKKSLYLGNVQLDKKIYKSMIFKKI